MPRILLTFWTDELHKNGTILGTTFCGKTQYPLLLFGNSRRFNHEDCVAAWEVEQAKNTEWITIEEAAEKFAITREILLSTTESKIVRIKCKDVKVLVNVVDVKQLKELKQWEEL